MLQGSSGAGPVTPSASEAEKHASLDTSGSNENPKPRSCVVCRSRKVRCDKRAPCSNCRRAKIACIFPPTDRPPRWARRLDRSAPNPTRVDPIADGVMERLHKLETLVKDLSSHLERTNSAATSATGGSSGVGSPEHSTHDPSQKPLASNENVQSRFGRLVLQDSTKSRYVSSGFWSQVNDELDSLKIDACDLSSGDYETSDNESMPEKTDSTQKFARTPAARHGFLFGHNLSSYSPEIGGLHPLPSQIPFLLDVFSENVNAIIQIVHLPTVRKMIRDWRDRDLKRLGPAQEALMFAIYYAAVTSMEEEDILLNFGATKAELTLKYRQGLEHALANSDFLGAPELILVQAFAIFLALLRRQESPGFVWMMTGLAIRMGQALGLHRDGSNFDHLSPYEVEVRRRVWWVLCMLDVRASEDQGTDYTILSSSFDTKIPSNLNDDDLDPESTRMPEECDSLSDMSVARVTFGICYVTRQMMAHGFKEKAPSPEEQGALLNDMYQLVERDYLRYSTESGNITYWAIVIVTRLVMAKMSLLVYLPLLFSTSKDGFSEDLRMQLLVAGIEVAEYNHALNDEQACRQWRWAFQTYTHWYSIVYMMIEVSRRPWSPISERAWVALHSVWLIPTESHMDKNRRIWIPLRKIMSNARKHRQTEITRLRSDPEGTQILEQQYCTLPIPSSSGPFIPGTNSADAFLQRWRGLVKPQDSEISSSEHESGRTNLSQPPIDPQRTPAPAVSSLMHETTRNIMADNVRSSGEPLSFFHVPTSPGAFNDSGRDSTGPILNGQPPKSQDVDQGIIPWLWPEEDISIHHTGIGEGQVDITMDMDVDINWYDWVESAAKGVEWDVPTEQ
ncbi:hypothetical protein N7452_010633 [Penicillium brevicompactum]|uniref:Zn(2)-C6 fungal-type domain-containing protein n=1 Tax=Penicillium brevicompactum TaxID=5074 RepID=A0A9W9Q136_PENBR|nr:hypothetical protein N7452_010633 [Penicillium brevicompactum]